MLTLCDLQPVREGEYLQHAKESGLRGSDLLPVLDQVDSILNKRERERRDEGWQRKEGRRERGRVRERQVWKEQKQQKIEIRKLSVADVADGDSMEQLKVVPEFQWCLVRSS